MQYRCVTFHHFLCLNGQRAWILCIHARANVYPLQCSTDENICEFKASGKIVVQSNTVVDANGSCTLAFEASSDFVLEDNSSLKADKINITALHVVISNQSTIDVSGRGSLLGVGAGSSGNGGTFGGSGGLASCADPSVPFYAADAVIGTVDICDSLLVGSGGGVNGGRGGGGVWITGEVVTIGGAILADGAASNGSSNSGSGSGGAVCVQADSLLLLGAISAHGANPGSAAVGAGGGGRVTLKYCDLTVFQQSPVETFGGVGTDSCLTGGAGTRYDRQQCGDDAAIHVVSVDNNRAATLAMTPLDDTATLPVGVELSELSIFDAAVVATRRLTVHSSNDSDASGALSVRGGSTVVAAPTSIDGSWSLPPNSVSLLADYFELLDSHLEADKLSVESSTTVEIDETSSVTFGSTASITAVSDVDIFVSGDRLCCG